VASWIDDGDVTSQILGEHPDRFSEVCIVREDDCLLVVPLECVHQKVHTKIDVGSFLFGTPNRNRCLTIVVTSRADAGE